MLELACGHRSTTSTFRSGNLSAAPSGDVEGDRAFSDAALVAPNGVALQEAHFDTAVC